MSSHLSIFPHKTLPKTFSHAQSNRLTISLFNTDLFFLLPGNFAYYLDIEDLKYRWHPPTELRDMLTGRADICLCHESMPSKEAEYIGWIDYAHPDGTIFSGMDHGLVQDVQTFHVAFQDTLVDVADHSKPKAADNCLSLSDAELKQMTIIAKRAKFLTEIANLRSTFCLHDINKFLDENREEAIVRFGRENVIFTLKNVIRFQPC